jgi:energy-converting hydrogenase B subunit D
MIEWIFDAVLAAALLGLAWGTIGSANLLRGVVLFIAYGLLMALVWVRLLAPDVALAEAAIGAGFTGVLLLDALGHMGKLPRTLPWRRARAAESPLHKVKGS